MCRNIWCDVFLCVYGVYGVYGVGTEALYILWSIVTISSFRLFFCIFGPTASAQQRHTVLFLATSLFAQLHTTNKIYFSCMRNPMRYAEFIFCLIACLFSSEHVICNMQEGRIFFLHFNFLSILFFPILQILHSTSPAPIRRNPHQEIMGRRV